jgi:hypothetical protein
MPAHKHSEEDKSVAKKPSLFGVFNFDADSMNDGRWFPWHGGKIKLRRVGGPRWRLANREAQQLFAKSTDTEITNEESDKIASQILNYAIAHAIIVDWSGFEEPFSPSTALQLIENQPDAKEEIFAKANNRENFRREDAGDAAPN